MHMRVLAPRSPGKWQAFEVAARAWRMHVAIDVGQRPIGKGQVFPATGRADVGADRQKCKGVAVEIPPRIANAAVAMDGVYPPDLAIGLMVIAHHSGIG